ncbi:acyl-CoA thioesterase [Azonexus sp.]|uniref:acyl-CoA thioesterase n=1 Tax=Azonexus sp. TaxID=1872668 RepID=UPI0039E4D0F8
MARIKIELPEKFIFSTDVPLYIQHINYGQHLDNAALLMLIAEARVRFFQHFGWRELDVEGVGIVVADVAAQYRSEAFHGESLHIEFATADFNDYGCDLVWRATDQASGREVARGKHGIVFFDYKARSKAKVPAAFRAKTGA